MKTKYKSLLFLLVSSVLTTSCFDLSEQVYSRIPLDNFFKTEQDVLANAARAYVKLQHFPEEQMLWSLMENSSDELVIPKRDDGAWYDQGRWNDIHNHKVNAANKINLQ